MLRLDVLLRVVLAHLPLFVMAGCAFVDSSVSPRVAAINEGFDQATSNGILTNIVRASHDQPLTFVALSKVSGTQNFSSSNGLPTLTLGPHLTNTLQQAIFGPNSLTNAVSGSFDVGPLSTDRDFARGLLDDVSLAELDLLIKQGISRDLIFALAIDGFEYVEMPGNTKKYLANDPTNYCNFRYLMEGLLASGFTTESRLHKSALYDKDDKSASFPRIVAEGRFCFDPTLQKVGNCSPLCHDARK